MVCINRSGVSAFVFLPLLPCCPLTMENTLIVTDLSISFLSGFKNYINKKHKKCISTRPL
uniref:Uncharacterized protein n=1 Tax=Octopus bimaculoides TaxID=37653 RepID=A0A0L8GVJ0_OCTBM